MLPSQPETLDDATDPAARVRRAAAAAGVRWPAMLADDPVGDIDVAAAPGDGYFFEDTRLLSVWRLALDGRKLELFSAESVDAFSTRYRLRPAADDLGERPPLIVYRHQLVDLALAEHLVIVNEATEAVEFELALVVDSDFADTFELRGTPPERDVRCTELPDGLRLDHDRDGFHRSVTVHATGLGAVIQGRAIRFRVRLQPHAEWHGTLTAWPTQHDGGALDGDATKRRRDQRRERLDAWYDRLPRLRARNREFEHVYDRSVLDLNALALDRTDGEGFTFGAGAPLFMTLFGRDALLTSFALLAFDDQPAAATLRSLAALQGAHLIDRYDEDPGRIHHELRLGEVTYLGERPQSPYYGASDTTPLFLVLLDEHRRFAGSDELARELEAPARAALEWIDRYGDRDGDGYVEYQRRNLREGLQNHCWKDSDDSIRFADGRIAEAPIAVCEIQGYVYDAKRRAAAIAREVWDDPELAGRLEQDAARLRERFHRDFWMPEREYFALALDRGKRRVDSITSNAGHLLFSGIAEPAAAERVAARLLDDDVFSGYGIRTMASGEAAHDPVAYHNGSIWPHDNAIIVAGLARYGFHDEAARVARAMFDAAACHGYRLPEVFAGYPRSVTGYAIEYPHAQIPLAMASASVFLLLRTIAGLEPGWAGTARTPDGPLGGIEITRAG